MTTTLPPQAAANPTPASSDRHAVVSEDAQAARKLTDRIKLAVEGTWHLITEAYTSRAYLALGYANWDDYCTREFGTSRLRLPREERSATVGSLREAGLSIPAIAMATGLGVGTVHRAINPPPFPNGKPDPVAVTDVEADQASTESWPADDDDAALTQAECEALDDVGSTDTIGVDDGWGDSDYDNVDELPTESAPVAPERITGTDGKSYPKPAPRAPSRRALTDDASRALDEVWAKTGRLAAVTADDRFRANRQAITDREGPKVLAALRELAAFAAAIKTGITPETERARDNWAASLSDVIEVLTDLNNQSPQEEL